MSVFGNPKTDTNLFTYHSIRITDILFPLQFCKFHVFFLSIIMAVYSARFAVIICTFRIDPFF